MKQAIKYIILSISMLIFFIFMIPIGIIAYIFKDEMNKEREG